MKKTLPAFLAALLIAIILGAGMFIIGQDALRASTAQAVVETTTLTPETLTQLEQALAQYQTREVQYQAELNTAIERINAANQQIQEYQNLLNQLQNSGLITVTSDDSVIVNQLSFSHQGNHPERNH